jgi:hypothetical protein
MPGTMRHRPKGPGEVHFFSRFSQAVMTTNPGIAPRGGLRKQNGHPPPLEPGVGLPCDANLQLSTQSRRKHTSNGGGTANSVAL